MTNIRINDVSHYYITVPYTAIKLVDTSNSYINDYLEKKFCRQLFEKKKCSFIVLKDCTSSLKR